MNFLLSFALAVTLTWVDNSDNEDGFRLYRQMPEGAFVILSTVGADVATVGDPAAEPGACYKVAAFDVSGESGPSNTVCLPLLPAAPSGLQAKQVKQF